MRAAVINESHGLEIVFLPDPTPGPGEIVLKVKACGICGSDLKSIENTSSGYVMGHEFVGEIVAQGDEVQGWQQGQLVTALPIIGCGKCVYCLTGDVAHCKTSDRIGVDGSAGAFAEYVRVSSRETFALPSSFVSGEGALVEPLAVALHVIEAAEIKPGDDVLIIGAGPIGLAAVIWARHLGAREITVSDPMAGRRELASKLGADHVIDPAAEKLSGRYGVVLECVGIPGMIGTAIRAAALHGRVVVAGACQKPDTFVPMYAFMKELSLRFSIYYRRQNFAYTVAMLTAGRIDPRPLISSRVSLDELPGAFKALKQGAPDQCKVIVEP
jgi:(R,R)-butanediol dehydrogenase / meso-butanediol dehydrogenase / diacetyl reductase